MRLKTILQTNISRVIPINYQHFLSSVIYNLLAASNLKFATALHNGAHTDSPKKFKWFTFSWLQIPSKQKIISNSTLKILPGQFTWFISSPWGEFIQYLVNGLLEKGEIRIEKERFQIVQVETLPDVISNRLSCHREPQSLFQQKFSCLSPLVVTTKKEYQGRVEKYYYKPEDSLSEISEKIRQNLINKYCAFYNQTPKQLNHRLTELRIEFDKNYIKTPKAKILSHYIKSLDCHSRKDENPSLCHPELGSGTRSMDIQIPAIMCPFTAIGSQDLIKFGYDCGFGELNSAGFGMVKII